MKLKIITVTVLFTLNRTGIKVVPCLRMVHHAEREKLETCLVDKWIEFIQWTLGEMFMLSFNE